ncbi:MAG: hypothetical protein U0354_06675 [Candidatus Sericytochromatia bacterium]
MKYLFFALPFFVISCSSSINNKIIDRNISTISLSQMDKKIGADLKVNIDFKKFTTKASSDGIPPKTVNDIKAVKLYLITDNNTNPLLSTNVKFNSDIVSYPTGSLNKTYTFFNVPEGKYYVALELFDDTKGTNNIIEPISYEYTNNGDTAFGMLDGKRGLTISTNYATVTAPSMNYTFSDNSSFFNVYPKLLNAIGASIGTTITPQAGTNTLTGDIILQQ